LITGRNAIDCRNLHPEGVCLQFAFRPGGQIQKSNSGHLPREFGRWANHLANQFAISCAVGWVLANGKWQSPRHNIVISKKIAFCHLISYRSINLSIRQKTTYDTEAR
jgi:hypothetical protein